MVPYAPQNKRVKVGGAWKWQQPTYFKLNKITTPAGRKINVKVGTQTINRCWRFMKNRLHVNQHVNTGSVRIQAQVRFYNQDCNVSGPNIR